MLDIVSTANRGGLLCRSGAGRDRLDQRDQFHPQHYKAFSAQKHAFACSLGGQFKSGGDKACLSHHCLTLLGAPQLVGFCRYILNKVCKFWHI